MNEYVTHVFDLDGVILASNSSKSRAFLRTALPYGRRVATEMVRFHQTAGSISRRQRWGHFFSDILKREPDMGELDSVVATCTDYVEKAIKECQELPGFRQYLASLHGKTAVVSGVEHQELLKILSLHGLRDHFTYAFGGLPGVLKSERLIDLVLAGLIIPPAVYYGDTEDDLLAAQAAKMDFVLVYGDSEWRDGKEYCESKGIPVVRDFVELVSPTENRFEEVSARVSQL